MQTNAEQAKYWAGKPHLMVCPDRALGCLSDDSQRLPPELMDGAKGLGDSMALQHDTPYAVFAVTAEGTWTKLYSADCGGRILRPPAKKGGSKT